LTGQVVWPATEVLCSYIIQNPHIFDNKAILELGSGVGICGILASHFAKLCVVTDNNEIVLDLLSKNIQRTRKNHNNKLVCKHLDWGTNVEQFHQFHFDVIIASDVVYVFECRDAWKKNITTT